MSHIVESCPVTKLNGGLLRLHSADEDDVSWLTSYGSRNAYEKKKWFQVILFLVIFLLFIIGKFCCRKTFFDYCAVLILLLKLAIIY